MEKVYEFAHYSTVAKCLERTPLEWTRLVLQVIILVLVVLGNSLVILSILLVKILRHPRNFLILSLAMADILVGLFVIPFQINITENCYVWKAGSATCYLWVCGDVMLCTASVNGMLAISIDKYFAIRKPLFHRVHFTKKLIYVLIFLAWILSFVMTIPYWWLTSVKYELVIGNIATLPVCIGNLEPWQQILGIGLSFFLPLFILMFVYGSIAKILMSKSDVKSDHVMMPGTVSMCTVCKFLHEKKGCIMSGIVLLGFVVCWLPFCVLTLVETVYKLMGKTLGIETWVFDMFIWLGYFDSSVNPLIYTMFNQDFRFAFKELLCCRCLTINSRIRSDLYSKQIGASKVFTTTTSIISRTAVRSNYIENSRYDEEDPPVTRL